MSTFQNNIWWSLTKSNYDKLYQVLRAWYSPDQVDEIWAMLKDYDQKIHKKYLERQASSAMKQPQKKDKIKI